MATATLPKTQTSGRKPSKEEHEALHERARRILDREIDFIPNPEFEAADVELSEVVSATLRSAETSGKAPLDLPAHLRRFCESDLLTHEQEIALFREMNYLKYRANVLRTELDPDDIDVRAVATIGELLDRARSIRDHIIKANTRLVMSIVKKFVTPQQSFDDMLSDGIFTLMQAVEKFDYDRGFRFSTYAYRSIARDAYRHVKTSRSEESRFTRDAEDWAFEQEDDRSSSTMTDQVWSNLRELAASMLGQLDRRERFIIRGRYALGAHRKARTFQDLANKLGVSKERVRQLEQRAVSKLKDMVDQFEMDELFAASMV